MNNCKKIRQLIPLGVSNDLNQSEMSELQQHIADCTACRDEFSAYQSLTRTAGQLGEVKPQLGDDFWTAQRQRILSAVRPPPVMPKRTPVTVIVFRYAAVLLVGIVAGLGLWQYLKSCPTQVVQSPEQQVVVKPQNNLLGAELEPLTRPVANHLGINPDSGFIVSRLPDLSPARQMGLRRGDIVLEINGRTITSTIPGFSGPINIKIVRNGNVIEIGKK